MRGEPGTSCKLHMRWGHMPDEIEFLVTAAGSAYRLDRVAGRTLHCTRWRLEDIPENAACCIWRWARR